MAEIFSAMKGLKTEAFFHPLLEKIMRRTTGAQGYYFPTSVLLLR